MNLTNRYTKDDLNNNKTRIKKILFFRVCGTGMGAAACLMKEAGYDIYGTDKDYFPPMSDYLEKRKIPRVPFESVSFSNFDLIVVGNVVPRLSDEAKSIEESGIPFCSFPELIGEYILKDRVVIGVSGTHGKTTTTYMLTQMLEKMGKKPGYLIGGVLEGKESSSLGSDDIFIIESDEYDTAYFEKTPKFIHYYIDHLIVTSLEYDHADIYSSITEIKNEFVRLAGQVDGKIVFNEDYKEIDFINRKESISFGLNSSNGPIEINYDSQGVEFDLDGEKYKSNFFGTHNVLNLSACILLLRSLGVEKNILKTNSTEMKFAKRRQEHLGTINGVSFFDDFAHHPTAMDLTIESFKQKFNEDLTIIFEPASATARSNIFQDEFQKVLEKANRVFLVAPLRSTSARSAGDMDVESMAEKLTKKNVITDFGGINEMRSFINNVTQGNVVFMSNGKLLGIKEELFK